jgi:uncharacterized protein YcfJ
MVSKNARGKWIKGAIAVAVGTLVAGSALADNGKHRGWDQRRGGYSDVDYARVVDVDPIVRRIRVSEPRRECYQETRYEERRGYDRREYDNGRYETRNGARPAAGAMILGGLIGAAVGNQVGSGDGRRAATVAGAIIGSAIGHDNSQRNGRYVNGSRYDDRYDERYESRPYSVERCDVRYEDSWEERIEGYRVTYEYQGRHGTMTLPYDPGPRVRVRVDVRPDEG